jgi:transposase
MILLLAEDRSYADIQAVLETTAPTIARWKKRFVAQGMGGLFEIHHPGQKPSVITPKLQARVLEATRRKPRMARRTGRSVNSQPNYRSARTPSIGSGRKPV